MFLFQIILGLIIIFCELKRKKSQSIDLVSIFNLLFFICYVLAPISVYYMLDNASKYSVLQQVIKGVDFDSNQFYWTGILILFGYLCFILSFSLYKPKKHNKLFDPIFLGAADSRFCFQFGMVVFVISLVCLVFASLSMGGLFKWVVSNPRLYYDRDRQTVEASSWLLDKGVRLMFVASYFFWGLLIKRKKVLAGNINDHIIFKSRIFIRVLFLLSFFFSCLIIVHAGGRLLFFEYFAFFFISNLYINKKRLSLKLTSIMVVAGGFILLYGRTVFRLFIHNYTGFETVDTTFLEKYFNVINNYTFPFFAAKYNFSLPFQDNLHYFVDILAWPLQILPTSFRPEWAPYASELNTFRLMNIPNTAIVPTDIISYGIMNAGVIGVIIACSVFGVLVKIINRYAENMDDPIRCILFVVVAFLLGFRVMYFDPVHLFKGSLELILCLFIFGIFSRIKKTKY